MSERGLTARFTCWSTMQSMASCCGWNRWTGWPHRRPPPSLSRRLGNEVDAGDAQLLRRHVGEARVHAHFRQFAQALRARRGRVQRDPEPALERQVDELVRAHPVLV